MFRVKQKSKNRFFKIGWFGKMLMSALLVASLSSPVALAKPVGAPPSQGSGASSTDTNTTPSCPSGTVPDANDKCVCPSGNAPDSSGACPDPAIKCTNNQCDLIKKYVNPTITLLAAVFGTIAAISIILGGINYTTSEGDPQKAARAKSRIINTTIAVVAFLFLYAFLQFLIPGGIFNRPVGG